MDEEKIINELLNDNTLHDNFRKKYGNLYLSDYQVKVLERNNIDYNTCSTMTELSYKIEDILNNSYGEDDYELEEVSRQIDEYRYYNEINH